MPRTKRQKVVALTKVKKKGKDAKDEAVESVQECLGAYKNAFALSFENMRTGPFKQLQRSMREDSKFFFGKLKVLQHALGHTPEDEHADNSHLLSRYLRGHVCLLLTNRTKEQVEAHFSENEVEDFAAAGQEAPYTVFLEKGLDSLSGYAHSLEPYLK